MNIADILADGVNVDKVNLRAYLAARTYNASDFGVVADGSTDDTAALQALIDTLNPAATSVWDGLSAGGTITLPPGVIKLGQIKRKSNVHIRGAGIGVTRILPAGTSGYVFKTVGTSAGNFMLMSNISDLSIGPNDTYGALAGTRPTVGGIDNTNTQNCHLRNIMIHNIQGIALNGVAWYDAMIDNVTVYFSGTASVPAVALLQSTADVSNALKFFGLHVESCPYMLEIGTGSGALPQTQNEFVSCKFEWGSSGISPTGPAIRIEAAVHQAFIGCELTVGPTTSHSFIRIKDSGRASAVIGTKFVGCGLIGATNHTGRMIETFDNRVTAVTVSASTFENCTNALHGSRFNAVGNEFYNCCAPVADLIDSNFSDNTLGAVDFLVTNANSTNIVRLTTNCIAANNKVLSYSPGLTAVNPVAFLMNGGALASNNQIASGAAVGYYFATTGDRVDGMTGNNAAARYSGGAGFAQNNWLDDAGSFTGTMTGVSGTAPTGTFLYERHGKSVLLTLPDLSGTSNATTLGVTGVPDIIKPSAQRRFNAVTQDNGGNFAACAGYVTTSNTLSFSKDMNASTAFTGSGKKQIANGSAAYQI